jgi:hypothetical protein
MSYVVHIIQPPVPADDDAAWELMWEVAERENQGAVPQVFQDLITRLTQRYPCICDLPDDQADDGVWTDGPLRNNATPNITILGIRAGNLRAVQPFVVSTANALGLVVFDMQLGKVYRPATAQKNKPNQGPKKATTKKTKTAVAKKPTTKKPAAPKKKKGK